MRVLHVVDSRQLRGGEIFASDLIRALNGFGIDQRVGVLRNSNEAAIEYDAPHHVLSPDSWTLPGVGINPRTVVALRSLIRGWRPNVVQGHGGSSLKYTIPAVVKQPTKFVYRQIGLAPSWVAGFRRVAFRQLMRRTDCVVAVAEVVRHQTTKLFALPSRSVVTIPNGVDSRRIQPVKGRNATRSALGIPVRAPVILSLGALTWEKDPLAHLEVATEVLRQNPEARHIVAGGGPMRSEVDAQIRRRGLERRVLVLGPRNDVADLMTASDVVIFLSRPDGMEGMPATLIEAGMVGIPVVAYAVAGVPEVVVEGVTGYLISQRDTKVFAARVLELLADPDKRINFGTAAQRHCLSRFDIRTIAPRYLDVYRDVVTSKNEFI